MKMYSPRLVITGAVPPMSMNGTPAFWATGPVASMNEVSVIPTSASTLLDSIIWVTTVVAVVMSLLVSA